MTRMTVAYWLHVQHGNIDLPNDAMPFGTAEQLALQQRPYLCIAHYKGYPVHLLLDDPQDFANVQDHVDYQNLRSQLYRSSAEFQVLSRAVGLAEFFQDYQFCHVCGHSLEMHTTQIAKVCSNCHRQHFPRINPSIIVAVRKGRQILLAMHNRRRQKPIYTVLAGFVEIGETIENATHREVLEESGIHIKNLQYLQSQPWCFPNSLMLGFLAEYDHGDIVIQQEELSDAQWFDIDHLPENLPEQGTISRFLIEQTVQLIRQSNIQ
ncbi:NAD(+) diphosphatase [Acinetobacter sp. c2-A9]|uniref:NAD(+) diphosphatase n=1 Tax=Acinetobacter sp. c2-A9 TaxID=3342802 RepID=UPI0035BA7630